MSKPVRISLISSDTQLAFHLQLRLQSKGYQVTSVSCASGLLGAFYSDPPDLLLIDLSSPSSDRHDQCVNEVNSCQKSAENNFLLTHEVCTNIINTLRSDSFFSAIPILGLVASIDCDTYRWDDCLLDDFIHLPLDFNELFCRISLSLSRLKRIFDNNPLTRLPGNTSIHRAIKDAMGKEVAVCYVDINHFKPYNDVYGFSHGDEVIRMLSRITFNAVRDSGGGFCGHIGGDDFVCIMPIDRVEGVCQTIIAHFDQIVLDLYDEETKQRGYYDGCNRKGEREQIPLLSVSIGVVLMNSPKILHHAKVAEVAAELKKLAKSSHGSRYVIDHRKT